MQFLKSFVKHKDIIMLADDANLELLHKCVVDLVPKNDIYGALHLIQPKKEDIKLIVGDLERKEMSEGILAIAENPEERAFIEKIKSDRRR